MSRVGDGGSVALCSCEEILSDAGGLVVVNQAFETFSQEHTGSGCRRRQRSVHGPVLAESHGTMCACDCLLSAA